MKWIVGAALLAGMMTSAQASAAKYVLEAQGTVDGVVFKADANTSGGFTPITGGLFGSGDGFRFRLTFDTDRAVISSLYAADPTINIYDLPNADARIESGTYTSVIAPSWKATTTVQLWDGYGSTDKTDAQSFSTHNYDFGGSVPFDLGGGLNSEMVTVNAFDWTALLRASDSVDELVESSSPFTSNSMSYVYMTGSASDGPRPVIVADINRVTWTLTRVSAVPEPATWALMLAGMMMTSYSLRRRNAVVKLV